MKKIDVDLTAVSWHRSSESSPDDPAVEIAFLDRGHIAMRDSRHPDGPALIFTPGEWEAFLAGVNDGEFNRPGA